jgi:hypothetical protein
MRHLRLMALIALMLPGPAAGSEAIDQLIGEGTIGIDLRYRYEGVEQEGRPLSADANTLRARLRLASGNVNGFSGQLEIDRSQALGGQQYDDTRNGRTDYPVVADPEGTDLNQAWLQYGIPEKVRVRLGRQRINLDNQRFVGASDWRQNEQTFDAFRIETQRLPGIAFDYSFVDKVRRVFGPETGTPPATFEGASHLVNVRLTSLPVGAIVLHGFFLDLVDGPQLSSESVGARYEGRRALSTSRAISWALEYVHQQDAGDNPISIDAHYGLVDLRMEAGMLDLTIGREILSGERGTFASTANPAFQTPLATLHKWQGWADQFLTTPPAGIEDTYAGVGAKHSGWNLQAVWHRFSAESTSLHYGSELDMSVARKFADRFEVLLKYADYDADGFSSDTRKFWVQLGASF